MNARDFLPSNAPSDEAVFKAHIESTVNTINQGAIREIAPCMTIGAVNVATKEYDLITKTISIDERRFDMLWNLGVSMVREKIMPISIFLTTEVWCKKLPFDKETGKTGSFDDEADDVMPSQSKYRSEALAFTGLTIEGNSFMSLVEITRDSNGFISPIECPEVLENGKISDTSHQALLSRFFSGAVSVVREPGVIEELIRLTRG